MSEEKQEIDELDEALEGRVRYRFGAIPHAGKLKVFCPPIWVCGEGTMGYFDEYGREYETVQSEHLRQCFFAPILDAMEVGQTYFADVPDGLYRTEFLDLNPFDIQDLLLFQRKYGIVYGARAQKHLVSVNDRRFLRPEPDGSVFAGSWADAHALQLEGIEASAALFDTVPGDEFVDARLLARLGAVSFLEVVSTVYDAQCLIRDTLRVLRTDVAPITKRETVLARVSSEWLAALLPKTSPIIELVKEGSEENEFPMSLMDAIYLQLAKGLLGNESFRRCSNPECNQLFSPVEVGRRADTKYCCSECQERAKRLRYLARHSRKMTDN